ncbi:MAG TPA: YceD family protein [Nocardioidaceae bacterium]|nr:YceD family protein [Nocardioidaceae bacterium]
MPNVGSDTLSSLDPRAPLVLDTRELGRRPGSQRQMSFSAPAPADLGIEVLRVPEGSPVEFDLRLEAVMEGVLVTGTAHADLVGECARCLEEIRDDVVADFQELFVYEESDTATGAEDEDASRLEGDLLDLEPLLRDAVVLSLPFQPLCRDDCPGLCIECGARLADDPDHQHDEAVDPRWAALQGLVDKTDEDGRETGPTEE